eukprot:1160526-Pelagomonas_calceolata.AAC.15
MAQEKGQLQLKGKFCIAVPAYKGSLAEAKGNACDVTRPPALNALTISSLSALTSSPLLRWQRLTLALCACLYCCASVAAWDVLARLPLALADVGLA